MGNDILSVDEQQAAIEQNLRKESNKRAEATPLPSVLADAFLNGAIDVGDNVKVRRAVASDWPLIQWLNSPLFKLLLEIQKDESLREEVPYTDEEEWEMCWQFTHTPAQCRELKAKGREAFREVAVAEIGDNMQMGVQKNVVMAITQQVAASFGTKIEFASPDSGGDDSKKKL